MIDGLIDKKRMKALPFVGSIGGYLKYKPYKLFLELKEQVAVIETKIYFKFRKMAKKFRR